MKNIKLLLVGILLPIFSYATVLVDSDFEDGYMGGWVPKMSNECWKVDGDSTLQGAKNLKATTLGIADSIYAYTNVTYDLGTYTYEWKFMARSTISNLSGGNTYWFWLAADKNDFTDLSIKGYVVGINYNNESDDKLSVWSVNGTSVSKIINSGTTIGNDILAIKVTRSSGGVWTLYYNQSNSFDSMTLGGTATDTSITNGLTTTGPYFICTSSNSGKFRFDACTIDQTSGSIPAPIITSSQGTNVSTYVNEVVTFDITATVGAISYGGLFSTNKPSGSTFAEQTDDFPLSSIFAWTPNTIGSYTVIFTSTNETGDTTLTVNIDVEEVPEHKLWINEFHYDDVGADVNEGIEICGKAGINLSDYTIYIYEGDTGNVDSGKTKALSGTLPNEDNSNYGALWFSMTGDMEQGPEGIALVKNTPEEVLYFISYEGSFEANDGPASGLTSENVVVTESGSDPDDYSLQLKGNGSSYEDFTWSEPSLRSPGLINTGQSMKTKGSVFMIN